jgi:steroid delta-isomerase-like uncharacterized protein
MDLHHLQAHREALVRLHMEVEERGDAEAVLATFSVPHYDLVATGQVLSGAEGIIKRVNDLAAAMPDAKIELMTLRHSDDAVIVETRTQGIQKAELFGLPATGKAYSVRGVAIFRFDGPDLVDEIVYYDRLTILEQLGSGPIKSLA